jgi:hypothetical protein
MGSKESTMGQGSEKTYAELIAESDAALAAAAAPSAPARRIEPREQMLIDLSTEEIMARGDRASWAGWDLPHGCSTKARDAYWALLEAWPKTARSEAPVYDSGHKAWERGLERALGLEEE